MGHQIVIAASVIAVFLIERIFAGAEHSSLAAMLRRFQTTHWADVLCFLLYELDFLRTTIFICSFGLSFVCILAANALWHGPFFCTRLDTHNDVLNVGLYLIATSFLSYWSHRAFHRGLLWNFHRFHHSATSMNPLVEHRNHPVQIAVIGALFALALALVKVRPDYLLVFAVGRQFHQLLVHSNIRSSWGWVGRWVLVSPLVHRVHHSIDPQHHDKNFADDLIIWDRLFGTYGCDFAGVDEIGVADVEYNRHGPLYDVLADYGRAARQGYTQIKVRLTQLAWTS
jgi:sterol desaturase/sphingolipid hydroxylase (fatty acid hydroxylase superfamily)